MSSILRLHFDRFGRRLRGKQAPTASASDLQLDYWGESILPSVAILFLLPLMAAYELAALSGNAAGVRNSADLWLRSALSSLGLSQSLALPAALLAALWVWHWLGRHPFRCRTSTYAGVVAESVCIAGLLVLVGNALCLDVASGGQTSSTWHALASFLGAGIYEEVFFRLLLLPLSYGVLRLFRVPVNYAWGIAIAANAFLFATAHYLEPLSETFSTSELLAAGTRVLHDPAQWFGWLFRFTAGIAFCLLFVYRGLAVAVGSHVCYDILVGIVIDRWLASQMA